MTKPSKIAMALYAAPPLSIFKPIKELAYQSLIHLTKNLKISRALWCVLSLGFLFTSTVLADIDIDVSTLSDLESGIAFANTNCSGETAMMRLTQDIELSQQGSGLAGLPLLLPTCSNSKVVIDGNGFSISRSAAHGTPQFRFIEIFNSSLFTADLTLKNITLSGFRLVQTGAGVIRANAGTKLLLDNVDLVNNSFIGGKGAIHSAGELTILSSRISHNKGGNGAGLNIEQGVVVVEDSEFSNNYANSGGAIYQSDGSLTITNSVVSSNIAISGGAVRHTGGFTNIFDSEIVGNSGGAIVLERDVATNSGNVLVVANSTISGNTSDNSGAAITLIGADASLTHVTVTNNSGATAIDIQPNLSGRSGQVTLQFSILAGNSGSVIGGPAFQDVRCEFAPQGPTRNILLASSLIGSSEFDEDQSISPTCKIRSVITLPELFNIRAHRDGASPIPLHEILTPLADNGCDKVSGLANSGRCTRTHGLAEGSIAIAAIDIEDIFQFGFSKDQRGFERGGVKDFGAHEGFVIIDADEMEYSCFVVPLKNGRLVNFCL